MTSVLQANRVANQEEADAEIARLLGIMADALKAMDEGRYGDTRRILKTGKDAPGIPHTGVAGKVDCQP